jgi:hypothetical protein
MATIVTEHVETLWDPNVFLRLGNQLVDANGNDNGNTEEEKEWFHITPDDYHHLPYLKKTTEQIRIVREPCTGMCKPWIGPGYDGMVHKFMYYFSYHS